MTQGLTPDAAHSFAPNNRNEWGGARCALSTRRQQSTSYQIRRDNQKMRVNPRLTRVMCNSCRALPLNEATMRHQRRRQKQHNVMVDRRCDGSNDDRSSKTGRNGKEGPTRWTEQHAWIVPHMRITVWRKIGRSVERRKRMGRWRSDELSQQHGGTT